MIEYAQAGPPHVRCGEWDLAGRRIAAKAVPYLGDAGEPGFRFDPLERRLGAYLPSGRVAVGPADPAAWESALGRCPRGPVLVGPGSPAEEIHGAGAAAADGAARAGRGVYLLDPDPAALPSDPEGFVAAFTWRPGPEGSLEKRVRAAASRGFRSGALVPVLPGWTDEPGTLGSGLDRLAAAGAAFAAAVAAIGDGDARRVVVEARAQVSPEDTDRFFERVHHGDWESATRDGLSRFRDEAAKRGLAALPPRPRGRLEPRANSEAAARLEERAHELEGDEHRAALFHAAVRWIDESGRDLAPVVREGNFSRVFPYGALAAEAESAFGGERT